jgi:hypothetical protein
MKQLTAMQRSGMLIRQGKETVLRATSPKDIPQQAAAVMLDDRLARICKKHCPRLLGDIMTLNDIGLCTLDKIVNLHTKLVNPAI